MKLLFYGVLLFASLGIVLARETLARIGLESNYLLVAAVALLFTFLLVQRNLVLVGTVLLLCVAINMPPDSLGDYALDQDVLIAALLALIILPVVHRVVMR